MSPEFGLSQKEAKNVGGTWEIQKLKKTASKPEGRSGDLASSFIDPPFGSGFGVSGVTRRRGTNRLIWNVEGTKNSLILCVRKHDARAMLAAKFPRCRADARRKESRRTATGRGCEFG